MEVLTNIATGTLGAFVFLWWYSLKVITLSEWSWSVHVKQNYKRWVWIEIGLIILALVAYFTPEAFKLILKQQAFEIPNIAMKGIFLVLGYFIARMAKNKVNKVI